MKNMKTLRVKMVGLLATALILFSAFRADKPVITIFMTVSYTHLTLPTT